MEIGFIGLGKMGLNMVRRLLQGGHQVIAYDLSPDKIEEVHRYGAQTANSIEELPTKLSSPRVIWIMVPSGEPVSETIHTLRPHLSKGDILIDGGNSNFRDSMLRASKLLEDGIFMLDVGTSGGIWGLSQGYCLMAGGDEEAFRHVEPIFSSLAPEDGYARVGASGAGHFTKMVHNGIEYGLLQAYAEGFELLKSSQFEVDLYQIATLWNHGGVVRSWLLELAERAFEKDPNLANIRSYIDDSGEGRWTVHEAIDSAVPLSVITSSLFARFRSRQEDPFAGKVIAALRNEFGGHAIHPEKAEKVLK